MTETQTSACDRCGDTGYVPPFMDACTCLAAAANAAGATFIGEVGAVPGSTILDALAPRKVIPTTPLPAHPVIGETVELAHGWVVWTGDKWADMEIEVLTPAEYVEKYPEARPPIEPDVAEALDALGITDAAYAEAADALAVEAAYRAAEEADAEIEPTADIVEDHGVVTTADVIAETVAALNPVAKTAADTMADLVAACDTIPTPAKPKPVVTGKPMSDKQEVLLRRLVAERDPGHPHVAAAAERLADRDFTAKTASLWIDRLVGIPADPAKKPLRPNNYDGVCKDCGGVVPAKTGQIKQEAGRWVTYHKPGECLDATAKAALTADRVTEPGLYKYARDGVTEVYRVRRTSKRLYGELVVPHPAADGVKAYAEFIYNGMAMVFLRASDKLTWQEARDFGAAYGSCVACGRTLWDPRSLVQMYGSTCAGHYGWPTVTKAQAEAIIAGVITWDEVVGLAIPVV